MAYKVTNERLSYEKLDEAKVALKLELSNNLTDLDHRPHHKRNVIKVCLQCEKMHSLVNTSDESTVHGLTYLIIYARCMCQ